MKQQPPHSVAIVGFGNQGEAQALNLRDAGVTVTVGARPERPAAARARALGFEVRTPIEALRQARVAALLLPDEVVPALWPELCAALPAGGTLVFAHGFNLLYSDLKTPGACDVVLVAPLGPGRVLRAAFERGERLPAYTAVHQDASAGAWALAEAYASAIGCAPLLRTTVREETEADLFGEQAVLCGGMNALVTAAFETMVAAGTRPEVAYLECVHQLRYLAELLNERGVAGLRRSISGTALYGDLTRGRRVIGEPSRAAMRALLEEIRSGAFAREWAAEAAAGGPRLAGEVARAAAHPIEEARRRALGGAGEDGPDQGESRNAMSKN